MDENEEIDIVMMAPQSSLYKENILAYIAGFIVRKLHRRIDYIKCNDAMVDVNLSNVHSLISEKDRGELIYPSRDIIFIVSISERFFKSYVSGEHFLNPKISSLKKLR